MVRSALVLMALLAAPAWAVGERIVLPSTAAPFVEQMKETLCVSMECIAAADAKTAGLDATVTGKLVKNKKGVELELQVLAPGGAVKATVKTPVTDTGRISSMDLVSATSAVIAAIEAPEAKAEAVKEAAKPALAQHAKVLKKKSQLRLATKQRFSHSRG